MKKLVLIVAILLVACSSRTTTTPIAPTATLRGLPTATASPVFPTALPTDTPAPTSTLMPTAAPIAYVIQKGDTLIGIAVEYNVSLEAIEAANPGIDPGNLQLGQTVFVPAPEGGAPSAAVASTPLPVNVGVFTCAPTPVASLICYGEFVNTTSEPITNLSARVTLLNPDNTTGDSVVVYAPLDLIPPGSAVPLAAVFANGNQRAAAGTVLTADSGAALADRYAVLVVSDVAGGESSGGFTLGGTVTNVAAVTVKDIVVVGTVYNSAGAVIGYRKIALIEPLAASASAQFSITLPGVASAARWAVLAQGRTR